MNILIFMVSLSRDLDYCTHEVQNIYRAFRRTTARAMHASRSIAFVVTTEETSKELVERMGPVTDVGAIEAVWCFSAPTDIASSRGGLDSLEMRVRIARAQIGKWQNSKNMRQIQIRPRGQVKDSERRIRSAPIEVIAHEPADWTPPQKSNRYERNQFHRQNSKSRGDDDSF